MEKIVYSPIGVVHSPFTKKWKTPVQPVFAKDIKGTIEIFPEFEEGLKDLDGFSHIIVLFHLHKSSAVSLQLTPFVNKVERGVFATRAPMRPNGIGMSVVRLDKIEQNILHIRDLDMLDGTPVLDIKPYFPKCADVISPKYGWLENHINAFKFKK